MNGIELAVIEEVTQAWYPKYVNRNVFMHFRREGRATIILGFTSKQKADRWLRKHYPAERQNIVLKGIRTEVASMLWWPYLMIIKDLDMDWDLERIKEWDVKQQYEIVDPRLMALMPTDPKRYLVGVEVSAF